MSLRLLSSMSTGRSYQDAIRCLNGLQSNYASIMAARTSGKRKNVESLVEMRRWSKQLGYDVESFNDLNIIHITGTKGKGSTAAFTQSILLEYEDKIGKVGLFTSPHLRTVRERIAINGRPISEEKFAKFFFEVWDRLDGTSVEQEQCGNVKPGYFKFLTLLSFHVFMQERCNVCVYEVGIGGAYDSTNIVEKPVACGVSILGIDHTKVLGDRIEDIAWNKGGIFKTAAPAFTIEKQPPEGFQVLKDRAAERHTSLQVVPNLNKLKDFQLGIAGEFQVTNASLAVALSNECLKKFNIHSGLTNLRADSELPDKFVKGLKSAKWEGRCQTVRDGNVTWYIDGAHTKESIVASSNWFKTTVVNSPNKKILLFNQQTRDAKVLLTYLFNTLGSDIKLSQAIFTTNITWKSGSFSPDLVSMNTDQNFIDELVAQKALFTAWNNLTGDLDSERAIVSKNIESAVEIIRSISQPVDVFVTGSLHLVGGLLVVLDGK
ncbi:tetrahydrofolate synthase Ecym_2404 [Eremothecium cymbalariae DBVPG|uniref:Folylpolyglutamate synthase n=1 Tax=Eremothecium cymbalariae (strain CBS 270.75 / DBVPG 7215 / KCTC 17166 / NRRL Y-17582) TaxID=931890 RepID=G8JP79_ERECY|nr:Hypothetical protein Ecym_2404 [Eremothecium cymbalariae DBVPG\